MVDKKDHTSTNGTGTVNDAFNDAFRKKTGE